MNDGKCRETQRPCAECGEFVKACIEHDEYYVCTDCSCQMPMDKAKMLEGFDLLFKKAFGIKPAKPENN